MEAEIARREFFATCFPNFLPAIDDPDYALYEAHVVSKTYVDGVRSAAREAWSIYRRIAPLLRSLDSETLVEMGIPRSAVSSARIAYQDVPETVVGRFDFLVTDEGPKMIEFNAETPFFYWETHEISGALVRHLGFADPNEGAIDQLQDALASAVAACWRGGRVVVTAYTAENEDNSTGRYAAGIMQNFKMPVTFSPLRELKVVPGDGLYDSVGRIDVLYRFYPMELFALDEGGRAFFDLLEQDRLRVINPPCSLLLQDKCAQVLIWGLYEAREFFDDAERDIIERVFLPTYADLPDDGGSYVRKPVLGREGKGVAFVENGENNENAESRYYEDQLMIFQRRVAAPRVWFNHPRNGPTEGFAVTSCFVAGGEPTAVGMRIGREITDKSAHFFPLAYAP